MVEIKEIAGGTNPESEPSPNGEAIEQQPNGEAQLDDQQAPQENAQQPTRLESFFAITKSLILRALVFYFITSFFRRPAATPADQGAAGVGSPAKLPAFNYFENGSTLVNEDEF